MEFSLVSIKEILYDSISQFWEKNFKDLQFKYIDSLLVKSVLFDENIEIIMGEVGINTLFRFFEKNIVFYFQFAVLRKKREYVIFLRLLGVKRLGEEKSFREDNNEPIILINKEGETIDKTDTTFFLDDFIFNNLEELVKLL
jgi:hypothetical protein